MSSLNQLNKAPITASSQIPFFDPANGSTARAAVAELAEVIRDLLGAESLELTQYAAPNATGFNVQIAPQTDGASVWLLLTPTATFASGTITLPNVALCAHGQEVLANSTQAVTALTVAGNGAPVNGAPTTLAANGFFRLKFDGVAKAWHRVG